jgi:isocitrate/isopropylmalate dehydrogenase
VAVQQRQHQVSAVIQVLEPLSHAVKSLSIEFENIPYGTKHHKTGSYVDADVPDRLRGYVDPLFGSGEALDIPDHVLLWALLLVIRGPLQLYANVQPVRTFPGTHSSLRNAGDKDINLALFRVNSEGEYAGQGGTSHGGQALENSKQSNQLHQSRD